MVRANRIGWSAGARALVKRSLQTAVLVAVAASVPAAWSAGPKVGNVAAASRVNLHVNNIPVGSATFANVGSVTTVATGSARTIINYQYLSVGSGSTLQFTQPSARSRVFNRIQGDVPTVIDGSLKSNGIVYLVSPAGIIFGNGAVIQVGKFFAAAAHMTDSDFLAGRIHFTDAGGSVTNYGTITADQVHLVGSQVANFGQIVAGTGGVVTMTAGKDVYIGTVDSPTTSPRVMVKVSNAAGATGAGTGVTNGGSITAGQIRLGAGDLYAAGIYNTGVIKGSDITLDSGASTNITSGTVEAASATGHGGTIDILGAKVGVTGGSVNASGKTGGGTILIGGDVQGTGSTPTSQFAYIGSKAYVDASATGAGNGGKVVVFAEDTARIYGALSALGASGGSGGYVETSGKQHFDITTAPTVGAGGTWLVDPNDIEIEAGNGATNISNATPFGPTDDNAKLGVNLIANALSNNTSVTITTTHQGSNGTSLGAGNITWDSNGTLSYSTSAIHTLTLTAGGNITIAANITNATGSDSLTLVLEAGQNVAAPSKGILISGNISLNNGTFWSTGVDFQNTGFIHSNTAINILHTGNVTLSGDTNASANGSLAIAALTVNQTFGAITANSLAVATSGNNGNLTLPVSVTLNQFGNAFTTLGFAAANGTVGSATFKTTTALDFATIPALTGVPFATTYTSPSGVTNINQSVTIAAGGNINISNPISTGNNDANLTTSTGDINGVGNIAISGQNIVLTATTGGIGGTSPVLLNPSGNAVLTTGGANAAGSVSADFSGAISSANILLTENGAHAGLKQSFLSNANFTINSSFGTSDIDLSISASNGSIVQSSGSVTGNVLTLSAPGSLIGTATSAVSFAATANATISTAGNANATAGSENIFVQSAAYNKPLTFVTDSTAAQTIGIIGGGTTLATDIAAGANNTLLVTNGAITLNATHTLSGKTVFLAGTGDVTVNGNITAANATNGGEVLLMGNSVTGGGVITGGKVGVDATGALAGVSIALGNISSPTIAATGLGTVTLGTTGDTSIANVSTLTVATSTFPAVNGISGNGNNVQVTAAGNLSVTSNVAAGAGGNVTLNANGTNSTLSASSVTISGDNISLLATGGIGSSGSPVTVATTGTLTLTSNGSAHAGDIFVSINSAYNTANITATTNTTTGQTLSITANGTLTVGNAFSSGTGAGTDDIILSGTAITISGANSVAGANVSLTATSSAITGGTITATTLALNAGTTISLTGGNTVGTLAAVSNGTLDFTNNGGLIIDKLGSITGVSSNGNNITLHDTTGAIQIKQDVNAGGATAVVIATTGITGVTGANGTVTGGVVNLDTSGGDIGTSGTPMKTSSTTQLGLSGAANIFVKEANAIASTDPSRLTITINAANTLDLTASSIAIDTANTNFGGPGTLILRTSSGNITTTGAGTLVGTTVTLDSATGIGSAGTPLSLAPGVIPTLSLTASGAGIFVNSTIALDLGQTTISDTAGQTVALTAPTFTMSGPFAAAGDNLFLTATAAGGTALTNSITASNITLTSDAITTATGAFIAAGGTVTVTPFTPTLGINLSTSVVGGVLTLTQGVLTSTSANTFIIGNATQNHVVTIDTADISTPTATAFNASPTAFDLQVNSSGQYTFIGSLTLAGSHTLAINGSSIINSAAGTDITIGGTGTLIISGLNGDVGTLASPLTTALAKLGSVGGTSGHLFISNTGALNVSGGVALGSGSSATGNEIITHSPLTINSSVSVTGDLILAAGDSASSGDDLTVNNDVHAGGNINMTAGDGVILNSGIITSGGGVLTLLANHENSLVDGPQGGIAQSGTSGIQVATVNAQATTGITLDGSNNQISVFSAQNLTRADLATGIISLTNTGTAGLALQLGTITENTAAGSIHIITTGAVTQTAPISAIHNADLLVRTLNGAGGTGASITLPLPANTLGTGNATLQVRDASNGTTVSADVSFTTSGEMHIQQIQSGATVALRATTIDQVGSDPLGIQANTLNINSAGASNLTNMNNNFSTLSVTDTAAGDLAYTTSTPGGLTLNGFSQTGLANDTIKNANGSIFSNIALTGGFLSLTSTGTAPGGISLLNDNSSFHTVTANNTSTGDINIHQGSALPLTIPSLSETGGTTSLTTSNGVSLAGVINAGNGLTINVTNAAGTYSTTSAANISSSGPVLIVADHMELDPSSNLTASSQIVTLLPLTRTETISLGGANGTDTPGTLRLSDAELFTINSATGQVVLGKFVAPLDAANQAGDIIANGVFRLPTNVKLITTGNVALANATITTGANGTLEQLEVDHDGTFSLGTATINGGLLEFAANGSGPGGNVSLQGTLTTSNQNVTFNSQVQLIGDETIITTLANGTGGADISFVNPGTSSVASASHSNLTLQAGSGNISFTSLAGIPGSELGTVHVITVNDVTFLQSLSATGFLLVDSANNVSVEAVTAAGETITNTGILSIGGLQQVGSGGFLQTNALLVNLHGDIITSNGTITLNNPVVLFGATRTLDTTDGGLANGAIIIVNGNVTGGTTNLVLTSGNGSGGANITINGNVTGVLSNLTVTSGTGASGGNITVNGTATGLTNLTVTSGTGTGAGNIGINGAVTGGSGNVTLTAGAGNVEISAPITTTGLFTSTGHNFTNGSNVTVNSANISASGIRIIHTGEVTIYSTLNSPGFNVVTQGANVTLEQGAKITGDQVQQLSNVGVFVNDAISAPNGYFSTNNSNYTIASTGSITTNGADATITYSSGNVSIQGFIDTRHSGNRTLDGTLTITALDITTTATGTIDAGLIRLNAGSNDIVIGGRITGTNNFNSSSTNYLDGTGFISNGANFTNTASITAAGITLNHATGAVQIQAPLIATGSHDILIHTANITSSLTGTLSGANITLDSSGPVTLGPAVTGTGDFISNGTTFFGHDISAATITLNHTGNIILNGNLTAAAGTGPVDLNGAGVAQAAGIVNAGSLALTGSGNFTLADANTVGILAANITGPLSFVNDAPLTVGSAGSPLINGITTHNGLLSLTLNSGNLIVSQPIAAGSGTITFLVSSGNVSVNAGVTTTSTFASNGTAFTNTATIAANGITLNHTGAVNLDGALAGGSSPVTITGLGITSNANGTIGGGAITLTAGSGNVSLGGTITGSGLFTSTGAAFTNNAGISSAGANITQTGAINLDGPLADGFSAVNITGTGITSNANGSIVAGNVTLIAGGGNVALAGSIDASGLFHSTGAAFTNTTSITSAGANITHSGAATIDGALIDGGNDILINAPGIASNANGTMNGHTITLTAGAGAATLAGAINAGGVFTSTGAAFTNTASITSAGANITHGAAVNIDGAIIDAANPLNITGAGITSNTSGTMVAGNITLIAGGGNVNLAGTITASGLFHSTGAAFTNTASITSAGATLTHTGAVNLDGALIDGVNPVTITGVSIASNISGTITAGVIVLHAGSGNTNLDGTVTASGLFTSTGGGFTNNGSITASGITLTDIGAVTINNTMNADPGALSITNAASITDLASTLTGVGVTLHAGGLIDVRNTLDAGTGAATLTSDGDAISDTGAILAASATLTAHTAITASNITTSAGNITLNGPANITLLGDLNAGSADVLIQGPAVLGADVLVTGNMVDFSSTIEGAHRSLTVDASGATLFSGSIGSSGALQSLVTDAPGTTALNGSINTLGILTIGDPLTLTTNSVINGGTVLFGSTITGGGIASLAVESSQSSSFDGAIGAGTGNAITTFQVNGNAATFHGPSVTTLGGQTYGAPVLLAAPLSLTGTAFTFSNTINSPVTPEALTIAANGPVSFDAVVGGTAPLGSLTVTGSTGATLDHAITTTGNISIDGPITIGTTLLSSAGNIALRGAVTLNGTTNLTANGPDGITFGLLGITGNHDLTLISNANGSKTSVGEIGTSAGSHVGNLTFDSAGIVVLGGNIFANNLIFAYKDGKAAPTFNPTIATIYHALGDLTINTAGTFFMQRNESLAVFAAPVGVTQFGTPAGTGNLTIKSNNHLITIGDISAQGFIKIDSGSPAQTIAVQARPGVQVTQSGGGTISSPAVGITSGLTTPGAILLTGKLSINADQGTLNQVFFSSGAATVDIVNNGNLTLGDVTKILDFNRTDAITGSKFISSAGGTVEVLNQVPSGIGLPPQNQVNVVPRDIQTLQPERAAAISGALKDALQQLGIFARDMRTDELIEYLVGTALYDDVPYKLNPSPQDTQVAANRLPYAPVLPTVDAYRRLFLKPELDAKGNPVLDDKGKPKVIVQNTIIFNTFGQTWQAYKNLMKEKATPEGYRAWLEANDKGNDKNAAALGYLDQLRDLLNEIHSLGLTATEFDVSKKVLLAKVRPPNITEGDFVTAIMGPSTRTKNLTAMK